MMVNFGDAIRKYLIETLLLSLGLMVGLLACTATPIAGALTPSPGPDRPTTTPLPPSETPIPTPQPIHALASLGPGKEDFPPGYNPLTGLPAVDPSLLDLPALLVSISNFPAIARPQAGLSFAPMVFEFSITEGANRFLAVYYGGFPYPETPATGNCEVRQGPFAQRDTLLGDRVWLDTDRDGGQDAGEAGIGGVCVTLYDADNTLLERTTTDSNGYFAFNVQAGKAYMFGFEKPPGMEFTLANRGYDDQDSDVDASSGKTAHISTQADVRNWDAGMYRSASSTTTTRAALPEAEIGPVRSGRLLYGHISAFFQNSCLIYAFASPEVLEQIPKCSFVAHEVDGGGSMLEIERMQAIAQEMGKTSPQFNYASNLFYKQPPAGGLPANQIKVYFALLNQSGWQYDPASQAWLRYTDTSEKDSAGQLHPDTDRLNGRQLQFENVVIIMADHEVISPTNLNIHLDQGEEKYAWLFRDGLVYEIRWSTRSTDYEKKAGKRLPIRFINKDGSPATLKPGRTWVIIVTPFSLVSEEETGLWHVRFYAPAGAATGG